MTGSPFIQDNPLRGNLWCQRAPQAEARAPSWLHLLRREAPHRRARPAQWLRTFAGLDYPDGRIELKRDDEVTHEKNAPTFTQKLRVVCKSCNTGWMHELEEAVKTEFAAMVHGKPTTLTSQRPGTPRPGS